MEGIVSTPGYQGTMEKFLDGLNLTKQIGADFNHTDLEVVKNFIVDSVYKMPTTGLEALRDSFPSLESVINSTEGQLNHMNSFIGMNISDSPFAIITSSFQ